MFIEPRFCNGCHNNRIPDHEVVRKSKKSWIILSCRICKYKDIEPYKPSRIWNGKAFIEDSTEEYDD